MSHYKRNVYGLLFTCIVTTCLALNYPIALQAAEYRIMTEDLRPFGYMNDGRISGVCVEIVREVLKIVGHPDNIAIYPWKRAYHEIQQNSGCILFPIGRNVARENLFEWVGPLIGNTTWFYKKKGADIEISSIDDARLVDRISVRENYFAHSLLTEKGFDNLELTRDEILDIRKLEAGRVDLIALGELSLHTLCEKAGVDCNNMENTGVKLFDSQLYMAFSKDTPDFEIEKWQKALEKVKKDPLYKKIVDKYIR